MLCRSTSRSVGEPERRAHGHAQGGAEASRRPRAALPGRSSCHPVARRRGASSCWTGRGRTLAGWPDACRLLGNPWRVWGQTRTHRQRSWAGRAASPSLPAAQLGARRALPRAQTPRDGSALPQLTQNQAKGERTSGRSASGLLSMGDHRHPCLLGRQRSHRRWRLWCGSAAAAPPTMAQSPPLDLGLSRKRY
ncbi:MAG: hypothetical protein ACYC2U_07240 [Candidatus Amoebophilus sp.]